MSNFIFVLNHATAPVLSSIFRFIYYLLTMGDSKRKSKWKNEWLQQADTSGDRMGEYFVKLSDYSCKCLWCKTVLSFESVGKAALQQHA